MHLNTNLRQLHNSVLLFSLFNLFIPVIALGQLPVYKESHHQLVSNKPYGRVLDVRAESGDTTAFHLHANAICYVAINGSNIWLNDDTGQTKIVRLPDDYIGSDIDYVEKPLIHQFANIGKQSFRLIAVENLLAKQLPPNEPVSPDSDEQPIINNRKFTVRKYDVNQNHTFRAKLKYSLIILKSGDINISTINRSTTLQKPGQWQWIEEEAVVLFEPASGGDAIIVIVTLK